MRPGAWSSPAVPRLSRPSGGARLGAPRHSQPRRGSAREPSWAWPSHERWQSCTGSPAMPSSWRGPWAGGSARPSAPGHSPWAASSSRADDARKRRRLRPCSRGSPSPSAGVAWWRCPRGAGSERGGGGGGIRAAAPPPEREVERVAHLVLMQLLPAAGRGRSGELRRGALRGPADHRSVVRRAAGREFRPGPDRRAGRGHGRVGRSRCGSELLGAGRVRPGGRRPSGGRLAERVRSDLVGGGRFSRGDLPSRGPGSGRAGGRRTVIDSSFYGMYTDPSKPPVIGDLAGSRKPAH